VQQQLSTNLFQAGRCLIMQFPRHAASLHLTHNQHKAYYETVETYVSHMCCPPDCVSDEQRDKALATQELWELQWYPDTPIGSYAIYGADLDTVLDKALSVQIEADEAH
jgi:hypothetical protein